MWKWIRLALPVACFFFYLNYTSFDLGWSDNYGYLSLAQRLADFHFSEVEHTLASVGLEGDGPISTPLSYRTVNGRSVPLYPFGASALMAVLIWIAGKSGPFYLPPLMGALCLVLVYRIGKELGSRTAGILAATIALLYPPLFAFSTILMSDVPAAFFILLSTLMLLKCRLRDRFSVFAGLAAGYAFLIRPNMLLFLLPATIFIWMSADRAIRRTILLGIGFIPAFVLQIAVNWVFYGGPLISSYGEHTEVFTTQHFGLVAFSYLKWTAQFGFVFLLPFLLYAIWARRIPAAFSLLTILWLVILHVFYGFYPYWYHWLLTRYLLPAHLLAIIIAVHGVDVAARLSCRRRLFARLAGPAFAIALLAYEGVFLVVRNTHRNKLSWLGVRMTAKSVRETVGEKAVVFAYSWAGALREYEGIASLNLHCDPTAARAVITSAFERDIGVYALVVRHEDDIDMFKVLPFREHAVEVSEPTNADLYRLFPNESERSKFIAERYRVRTVLRATAPLPDCLGRGWNRKNKAGDETKPVISRGPESFIRCYTLPSMRSTVRARVRVVSRDARHKPVLEVSWGGERIGTFELSEGWTVVEATTPPAEAESTMLSFRYALEGDASKSFFSILCDWVEIEPIIP